MPEVVVKFYAGLKEKIGKSEVDVKANNPKEAIDALKYKLGDNFSRWVLGKDGLIKDYYVFLVNEQIVNKENLNTKKLKEGDILHIFPPIAGG